MQRFVIFFLLVSVGLSCLAVYQYTDPFTGNCLACDATCKTCFNSTYCLQCAEEYYLTSSFSCGRCSFGCKVCTSSTGCSTCNDGLYLTSSGECLSCANGVATCTIATVQTCSDGFFLLSSICAGCFSNCKTCTDFVSCTECSLGYFLDAGGTTCSACPSNCQVCTDASTCTSCAFGYTQSGGQCQAYSCSSFHPFCSSCSAFECLGCQKGTYLSGGTCVSGGSLLCLQSTGVYHTNCVTSSHGCPSYSAVQSNGGSQLSVCLPLRATKSQEFIYINGISITCGTCTAASTQSLSYSTAQAYYQISYYARVRIYSTSPSSRTIVLSATASNSTTLASHSQAIDTTQAFSSFTLTDSNCSNCRYVQMYIEGTLSVTGGQFSTNLTLSDSSGLAGLVEAQFEHAICQVAHCKACTSAVDCSGCFSPYLLQISSCVTSCDSGFYLYNNVCYLSCPSGSFTVSATYSCSACSSPCLTCSSATACLNCETGFFLEGTTCSSSCSSVSLFPNSTTQQCQTCPNPCLTCNATTNTTVQCLSCRQGYLLLNGSCSYFCPWGFYGSFLNGSTQCTNCSSECTSCYLSDIVCSSCSDGYLLNSNTCNLGTVCPSGYYADTANGNVCRECHYPCSSCENSQATCTSCQKRSLHNNQCVNSCPDGFYSSNTQSLNITCESCVSPCLACISTTSCSSCSNSSYLHQNSCVSTCPAGHYPLDSNNTCHHCEPPCKTCSDATTCLSCSTGYLDGGTCTLQCNSTAYVSSDFSCLDCPSPCLTCHSTTSCLSCQLPYLLFGQQCVTLEHCNNQTGYYPAYSPNQTSATSAQCTACSFPCLGCQNNSVSCLSCQTGYLFLAQQSRCYSTCPTSYYQSGTQCLACDSNCYTCSVTATNCTACGSGIFLQSNSSTCVSQCNDGYYGDDVSKTCVACQSPCNACHNAYLCKTCTTGILYGAQCVTTCPDATYHNTTSNTCQACINNCYTCNTNGDCLSCPSGYYLNASSCLATCPGGFYPNDFSRTCDACSSPCDNCTSSSACLTCISGYYLYNSQCTTQCESSYYADNATQTCASCNMTICLTCTGSQNGCLSCNTGYYMESGSCVMTCSNGSYADAGTGTCQTCPFSCASCRNYTTCTSCDANYYLFSDRCFSQCPTGYHADSNSTCLACPALCQICSSSTQCLSCDVGYYVLNDACVSNCGLGYYPGLQDITNYDHCLSCPNNCTNCSSAEYCLECNSPLIQFNGLCLTECPALYYNDSSSQCQACSQYCSVCVNSTYCTSCIGTYLYNNLCYLTCPAATFAFASACMPCQAPCDQCTGTYTCTTCLTGYIYFSNYCLSECPSGVWHYPHNNSCSTTCPDNRYQAQMQCFIGNCGSRMVSLNNNCLEECPNGYYVNLDQQCVLCEGSSICYELFEADLQILRREALTLVLYYNHQSQMAAQVNITVQFRDIDNNSLVYAPTSKTISPYYIEYVYNQSAIELVNITMTIPYVKSEESSQRISKNIFKKELVSYHDYSELRDNQFMSFIPLSLIVILLILVAIGIINKSSHYTETLDYTQLVAVTLYLDIQYPPALLHFLEGFQTALLALTQNMIDFLPYRFSPPSFIYHHTDTVLLRNMMPMFMGFFITLTVFLIIIAVHTYNPQRLKVATQNVRYRLLNQLYCICLTPLFLFACQFHSPSPGDIVITILVLLTGLGYVAWISYKIVNVKRLSELSGLLGDFQRTDSKLGLMYTPFGFVRRIVFTLGLGIAPYSPISTLTLLLVFTFLIMICVYFYQPFDNQCTDYVTIFMEISLILYVMCLIILALDVLDSIGSHNLALFMVATVSITLAVCIGWVIYLTVSDLLKKGWCPPVKNTDTGKDDYSDSRSKKGEDRDIANMDAGQANGQGEDNSANSLFNRFNPNADMMFSESEGNSEAFRHWSENASESQESNQGSLPHLLIKKERIEEQQERSKDSEDKIEARVAQKQSNLEVIMPPDEDFS